MFNKHSNSTDNANNNIILSFIKSLNIQAYPCGRRRSDLVDIDGNAKTVSDRYYLPFDPEARLNTESNNRKHSSLNGFTQTFIKNWENYELALVLDGYLFKISLSDAYKTPDSFCTTLLQKRASLSETESNATKIYANICIEEISLFSSSSVGSYYTGVLRDQARTNTPQTSLDLPVESGDTSSDKHYFSGLSFTTSPLAIADLDSNKAVSVQDIYDNGRLYQRWVSLQILEKNSSNRWQLYQPALLPDVTHGDEEGSVKVNTLITDKIIQNGNEVPGLKVEKLSGNDKDEYWQLQFLI